MAQGQVTGSALEIALAAKAASMIQRYGPDCRSLDPCYNSSADVVHRALTALFSKGLPLEAAQRELDKEVYWTIRTIRGQRRYRPKQVCARLEDGDILERVEDPSAESRPEHASVLGDMKERVASAIARLSQAQRECVMLRYFEGLSYSQIAVALGISCEAARSRIFNAHANLRGLLA